MSWTNGEHAMALKEERERIRREMSIELADWQASSEAYRLDAEQLRASREPLIPTWFVREFMANRHFWAAHQIDIVARKDGQEYRLEGDWLKNVCKTLEPKP